MDLKLTRNLFCQGGIFGVLIRVDTGEAIAVTLEHSYVGNNEPISYVPKLPPGEYLCVKGMHQLAHMNQPFETFEITEVPGHSNILLHVGNTNDDSEGCVLLGCSQSGTMILESKKAFDAFMQLQAYCNTFLLVVE